jgi:hypothetical protein
MQASHSGDWGQLWQMAQRLGSQAHAKSGRDDPSLEPIPWNHLNHMKSIYCPHPPAHKANLSWA